MTEFRTILQAAADAAKSRAALAKALHLTRTRVNEVLLGKRQASSMSVKAILRLAQVAQVDPVRLLRASGKADEADLLAEIFGTPGRDKLTAMQRDHLADLESLTPADRAHVLGIIRSLAGRAARRTQKR